MRTFYTWGMLALLTAGCGENPESARFILGEAREADGTPWRRGPLVLERSLPILDGGSSGMQQAFEPYGEVPVDPDGRFAAELFAFETGYWTTMTYQTGPLGPDGVPTETQTTLTRQPYGFRVRLPLEVGEAWMMVPGLLYGRDAELPPLQPWAGPLQVVDGPGGSRQVLAPPPPPRTLPRYANQYLHSDTGLEVRSDAGVLWRVPAPPPERAPDGGVQEPALALAFFAELVEGGSGELTAVGTREELGNWGTQEVTGGGLSSFQSALTTLPLAVAQQVGPVPASRGASCTPDGGTECLLTNGRVEANGEQLPDGGYPPPPTPVELGRPVKVRMLVLRNVFVSGTALRALAHTESGEEVELAWWPLVVQESSAGGSRLYLRAEVDPALPPVVRVVLEADAPPRPEHYPPEQPSPPGKVYFAGEVSVFE